MGILITFNFYIMGISRDSRHKRRSTGGRRKIHKKKRKYEMGRQPSNTKIGLKRIYLIRCRGGNIKRRAIRLEYGNFSWISESHTFKTRIINVVYNASNNELVRTKTLVKNCIVQIDATPFKNYYFNKYGIMFGKKIGNLTKMSKKVIKKSDEKSKSISIDSNLKIQLKSGRLLSCISSRPGQCGRSDGYILEGTELIFYLKKIQ